MTSVKRVKPTEEELKLLREKLNSIADIPYVPKQIKQQNKVEDAKILKDIASKDIVIKQLTQKVSELQGTLSKNAFKIANYDEIVKENATLKETIEKMNKSNANNKQENLEDYFNPSPITANSVQNEISEGILNNNIDTKGLLNMVSKLKSENLELSQKIKEQSKKLFEYEKQSTISQFVNNESDLSNNDYIKLSLLTLLNKNKINDNCRNVLNTLFKNEKKEYIQFLFERIDSLEYQNFALISKNEFYSKLILQYSSQLCEYIDVIGDIRCVLNTIPSNISLNDDFYVIRETLNKKEKIIAQEKNSILERKAITEKEDIVNKNLNCILCKDKISETKINLSNPTFGVNFEKCNEIVIDKINEMEAMKDMLSKYEDFVKYLQNENGDEELEIAMKCKEELTSYNSLLKDNNIKLKEIIMELMRNTENSINENLMLRINKVINETSYQGEVYDDLVAMMKVQAMLIEYDIGKGIYN